MKTVVVGFSRSSVKFPIFSWLIMWAEGVNFSHVYMRAYDESIEENVYYQASHSLVNCMVEKEFLSQEIIVKEFEFEVSEESFKKMKKFIMDNMGKPYGVKAIIGLAWVQILAWVGIQANNPFRDNGQTFVCSEFVATILDDLSDKNYIGDVESATPKEMLAIVASLPKNLNV